MPPLFKKICLLILCLLLRPDLAFGEEEKAQCIPPEAPSILDGRTARKQQMLDLRKTIETYMSDNDAYRKCLQDELNKLGDLNSPQAQGLKAYIDEAIVDSRDMDALVIDTYNTQVRIYKSLQE